jgi:hypothetical protein
MNGKWDFAMGVRLNLGCPKNIAVRPPCSSTTESKLGGNRDGAK